MSSEAVDREVMGACPLDCPDGCAWVVGVKDGRAVSLRGNREHPFTRGALCVKVSRYLSHARAPDRLLHPMRRIGEKGEGRFERVSWDDALDVIAERLHAVRQEWGGEAIWPYQGTGTMGYLQGLEGRSGSRLWNVLGASHHAPTICSIAGAQGLRYATGTNLGIDPESFASSRLILLWGTNTLTSHHHLWKFIQAATQQGAHLVAIDPLRTRTADQAHEHIAPLPGSDGALALGLLHVVLSLGAEDREYLERHTVGWELFRARIDEFTPQRVAGITGVEESEIVALGERIARTRPTAIRATMGLQRHAGGGMTLRTLASMCAVTGDWARHGGGLAYSTSGYFRGNRRALWREDLRERPVRELLMTRVGDSLLRVDDPPVKAFFAYGANPVASNPDTERVRQGLARPDLFTVVIEQFPTDTVDYADIVLPSTMQTEHVDLHDGYGHMYLAWNEPAEPPPGETLPHTEIFRRIADRMGLDEPALYDSDEDLARQLLDTDDPSLVGVTVERLRREGWLRLNYPRPFVPFADGFPTPSGRFEFFSQVAARDGHDPLTGFTPPAEACPSSDGGLALISPASHFFMNSMFGNHPELQARAGAPCITLHPFDAGRRGLQDGQSVRVHNARGAFEAAVVISDRVRPGVAATTKGHWPKLLSSRANVNATVAERDSDMGGGAVYHDNRVHVEAIAEPATSLSRELSAST